MADYSRRTAEDQYLEILESFPALIWRSGIDAKCNYFNSMWLEFTGRTLEQENGDGWVEGVHPEDLDRCVKTYLDAFARAEPFKMDYRLRRNDGEWRWIADFGRPFHSLTGEFAGYIGSCYDITDRVERADELEATVRERTRMLTDTIKALEAASETRSRFLHAMSHELLTPLNSILGFSGVLLEGLAGPLTEEQTKQMTMIRQAGASLFILVSDMLRVGESDEGVLLAAPVPLADVLGGALSDLGGDAEQVSIDEASVSGIIVNADFRLLRELVVRLFRTALSTSETGKVRVTGEPGPRTSAIRFEFTGTAAADGFTGSDEDDFALLGRAGGDRPSGSGLEFAIARNLVRALSGRLSASRTRTGGSILELFLPTSGSASEL
ncbi:MAG: PAS domain-containing sensor histidine kinase [Actinobacteria bacterium]|nr:PAS domain-containing sensor histidine kinase [Actinomycetota bacterium]MCG2807349.1 PAS domain-containing sensor histidine kinase [Coriobacteriia bacterium]